MNTPRMKKLMATMMARKPMAVGTLDTSSSAPVSYTHLTLPTIYSV